MQGKIIDISLFCDRILSICKDYAETKRIGYSSARGEWWEPLGNTSAGHFRVARDDRDGRSRYRASKISHVFVGMN